MPLNPDNQLIADLFRQVADLLELEDENPFRVRAYRNAARLVEDMPRSIRQRLDDGEDLDALPGIGKDLAAKMEEVVRTGRLGLLEQLKRGRGAGLARLLELPDLGPKRVRLLAEALDIQDLAGLRAAARRGRLAELPGFGERLQAKLLAHLQAAPSAGAGRIPWARAEQIAKPLLAHLRGVPGLRRLELAGSFRRGRPSVGDLDILAAAAEPRAVVERFLAYPGRKETVAAGPTRAALRLADGFQVDLRVVDPECFGAALVYFTGSKEHNVALRRLARQRGLKVNEYGVYRGARRLAGRDEAEVYRALGLGWPEPSQREGAVLPKKL